MSSQPAFRAQRGILVRSVLLHDLPIPPLPDLSQHAAVASSSWHQWVLRVWNIPQIATAVRHASPDLAREVDDLAERPGDPEAVRRLALSLLSYVLRLSRPTPFGLFAGITEGEFGSETVVRWGRDHQLLTRADGEWVAAVVQQLEAVPEIRRNLRVMANNSLRTRGERLVLPWQQRALEATGTAVHEVAIRRTAAVEAAVRLATFPVPYREVADKLATAHPELGVTGSEELLDLLISKRMFLTSLQPASTESNALGHVAQELKKTSVLASSPAAGLVAAVLEIHARIGSLDRRYGQDPERHRLAATRQMRQIVDRPTPLSVDVRMDADLTVPRAVAWETQAAAGVLARVTPEPHGTVAWSRYRARFCDRYGEGVLVPLMDLIDPHTGLGLPEDYHGTARAPRPNTVRRDRLLVTLAQRAAADGRDLVLDEDLIEQLAEPQPASAADAPAHVELVVSVHAADVQQLNAGEFTLAVRRVGRGWGHFSGGRFAALLAHQARPSDLLGSLARRPTIVHGALPVQLAFPSLLPRALHITHTPRLLAPLISLSEFREPDPGVFAPDDLAVICHQERLHLVSLSRLQVLEASIPHPLQIECQTPGVARFLDEMQRGQGSRLVGSIGNLSAWDWGAARHLAVQPRVRVGRSVLSPTTWRLVHTGLPGSGAPVDEWEEEFAALRERWRLPRHVHLEHWDERLPLDLDHPSHRALLRTHLDRRRSLGQLTLIEAEPDDAFGWCDGRPHEIVTCLASAAPRQPAPPLRGAPIAARGQTQLPGASPYVSTRLYCQGPTRHALLVDHLPDLFAELPRSIWWLTPRDEDELPHIMLTVRLAEATQAADALGTLGAWADRLIGAGVVGDAAFTAYQPHTGLWGNRATLTAAEEVLAADSAVVAYQHAHQHHLPPPPVLAAANVVAIAAGLHHSPADGLHWLSAQPKPPGAERLPKELLEQARVLAVPDGSWAAFRTTPLGEDLVDGPWADRHAALGKHRAALDAAPHTDVNAVLRALVSAHLHLAGEPVDGTAWRLARAAALASTRPRRRPAS
ncbi:MULTISPECIES: lantibiotic dehydratase [Streptomyces]|uniref:lantibiotic dehydratase n=1 Tax=Streptomyces TaxID=1883 RepID=UPI0004C23C3B|nr:MULTISPECIES: lantibiotic dehydratase [Streptomyces]MDX3275237.1 lantibiotic dehydratase [Streptomyces scabiei]MDX3846998.1 lantibiotic dehydratase [Streptomyces europaeiscabiei]